jgi:protein-tyrosine phosphatase
MTREHREVVLEAAPRQIRRTFTLSEAAYLASDPSVLTLSDLAEHRPLMTVGKMPDIPDPIGQSPAVFATVGSQIDALLRPILVLCKRSAKDV